MEFIQENLYLVSIAVFSGLMLIYSSLRVPGGGNALTPTEATLLINRENAQVVDVRDAAEYTAGHLPDARNIPLAQLAERISEIEKYKDTPVILVCQSGTRSGKGCTELGKLGFTKVHNLAGGIGAWSGAGLPVRKGAKK